MSSNDLANEGSKEEVGASTAHSRHLERLHTAGGHLEDRTQPGLPVFHRKLANPSPLGLISFATGTFNVIYKEIMTDWLDMFLICSFGLHARGISSPNAMMGVLVFFGGIGQFLVGIMEFVAGNTVCFNQTRHGDSS
jgi:hypothetical protein